MFVSRSRYEGMFLRAIQAETDLISLRSQWNALVRRINEKGGEGFLQRAVVAPVPQFSQDELARLVLLCHPDKHDGKPIATEMTQRLLALKQAITKEPA